MTMKYIYINVEITFPKKHNTKQTGFIETTFSVELVSASSNKKRDIEKEIGFFYIKLYKHLTKLWNIFCTELY